MEVLNQSVQLPYSSHRASFTPKTKCICVYQGRPKCALGTSGGPPQLTVSAKYNAIYIFMFWFDPNCFKTKEIKVNVYTFIRVS